MAPERQGLDARAVRPVEPEVVDGLDELADAFLALGSRDEVSRFLRDLCTLSEVEAMTHRWQIAKLVDEGVPYLVIAERLRASTTTVTRVAYWLRHGTGGYGLALDRIAGGSGRA